MTQSSLTVLLTLHLGSKFRYDWLRSYLKRKARLDLKSGGTQLNLNLSARTQLNLNLSARTLYIDA
jgi:hypothetical protein